MSLRAPSCGGTGTSSAAGGRVGRARAGPGARQRKKAGLTQAEVAEAMGVSQQRVPVIESGAVAELAALGDCIRALGGELTVTADFGDSREPRDRTSRVMGW